MAIEEANLAITRVCLDEADKMNAKRGPYIKLSEEMCAKIGKYASENGDTAAAWHFAEQKFGSAENKPSKNLVQYNYARFGEILSWCKISRYKVSY